MREKYYLDNDWYFSEKWEAAQSNAEYDEAAMQSVRIPHTVKELPFHYFDEHAYQMVSGYRRHLLAKKEWEGKVVRLTFEGVAHDSEVYVNGKKAGAHHCGYTAFTIDISALLYYGEDNIIAVRVDSNENLNVPPFGFVIDYMTYGGIYRDVYLEINEESYLADVFLKPQVELEKKKTCCYGRTSGKKVKRNTVWLERKRLLKFLRRRERKHLYFRQESYPYGR